MTMDSHKSARMIDREVITKAMEWAAKTPLKMGNKKFEDGIKQILRAQDLDEEKP